MSANPGDQIKTFALGSCVAVLMFDTKRNIAGMLHFALPDSSIDAKRGQDRPGYFADLGIPFMIEDMKKMGAVRQNVRIKLVGGASVMDDKGLFDIGKRNILAAKKILWKSSLGATAEDTGGEISRTVTLFVETGGTLISSGQRQWEI